MYENAKSLRNDLAHTNSGCENLDDTKNKLLLMINEYDELCNKNTFIKNIS